MGLLLETYMPRLEPVTMAVLFCMDVLAKPLVESRGETLATDAARQMLLDAIAEAMMRGCMYKISRKYFMTYATISIQYKRNGIDGRLAQRRAILLES